MDTAPPAPVAGVDLDWTIAQLAGWKLHRSAVGHHLISPDGKSNIGPSGDWPPETIWRMAWELGYVPHYSAEIWSAFELLKQMPTCAVFRDEDDERVWGCTSYLEGAGLIADANADTPELAICLAYMQYHDWKQRHDEG